MFSNASADQLSVQKTMVALKSLGPSCNALYASANHFLAQIIWRNGHIENDWLLHGMFSYLFRDYPSAQTMLSIGDIENLHLLQGLLSYVSSSHVFAQMIFCIGRNEN